MPLKINTSILSFPSPTPPGRIYALTWTDRTLLQACLLDKVAETSILVAWDLESGSAHQYAPGQPGCTIRFATLPTGKRLTCTRRCGEGYASLRLWSPQYALIWEVDGRLLWLDPQATKAWIVTREGALEQWCLSERNRKRAWETRLFDSMRWDPFLPIPLILPHGKLALLPREDVVEVFDLVQGRTLKEIHTGDDITRILALPDNRFLTASFDDAVQIWDLLGQQQAILNGTSNITSGALTLSPDGQKLFAAYDDSASILWDLSQASPSVHFMPIPPLEDGAQGMTNLVRFHQTEGLWLTAHQNHLLHFWNLVSGQLEGVFTGQDPFTSCAISPDGQIVVGDIAGQVTLLQIMNHCS